MMKPTAEHEKVAGYWNIDNGTGKIRGIYLQGNEMCRPIFEKWLEPFKDMGATTITNRNTGGTDHQAFDAVGMPGFQFIQDTMDYNTRTHHTNMDVYDRIQATDMLQMSAIEASMVYLTAVRPEKLPRKPLPPPQPAVAAVAAGTNANTRVVGKFASRLSTSADRDDTVRLGQAPWPAYLESSPSRNVEARVANQNSEVYRLLPERQPPDSYGFAIRRACSAFGERGLTLNAYRSDQIGLGLSIEAK